MGRGSNRGRRRDRKVAGGFNTPFSSLGQAWRAAQRRREAVAGSENGGDALGQKAPGCDQALFAAAMKGVKPIGVTKVRPRPPGPLAIPSRRPLIEDELEAFAQLVDLVSGHGPFDIRHTDEYIEGAVAGVEQDVLRRLRRGDFSTQAHLDLHGMTSDEARLAVERFIGDSVRHGLRCVLIIHGRGLNSRDQIPILKQRMSGWLQRGRLKRLVLAFATARPCDGGAGAMYVLLRRP